MMAGVLFVYYLLQHLQCQEQYLAHRGYSISICRINPYVKISYFLLCTVITCTKLLNLHKTASSLRVQMLCYSSLNPLFVFWYPYISLNKYFINYNFQIFNIGYIITITQLALMLLSKLGKLSLNQYIISESVHLTLVINTVKRIHPRN